VINIFKAWWVREQRGLDLEALVARPEISSVRIEDPDRLFLMWKTFLQVLSKDASTLKDYRDYLLIALNTFST
jgi:hypothetical protein